MAFGGDAGLVCKAAMVRASVVAVLCVGWLWPITVHGSPAEQLGFGPKSQALAATGVADAEGYAAAYSNPALLGGEVHPSFVAGFQATGTALAYQLDGGQLVPLRRQQPALFLGFVTPFRFQASWLKQLTVGVAAVTPGRVIARANLLFPERPQFPIVQDRLSALNLAAGMGLETPFGLRAGLGVVALAGLAGRVALFEDSSETVVTRVEDELLARFAPSIGLSYGPASWLDLGLAYKGALESDVEILVSLRELPGLMLPEMHIGGVAQYDPEQLAAEAKVSVAALSGIVGLSFKKWSNFPGWLEQTVQCPEGQACAALPAPAADLHDTWVPRLAGQWEISASGALLSLRAGYFYEPTPLSEQRGSENYWDNDRHVLSAGYAISSELLGTRFTVQMALQHHFLVRREHHKDPELFDVESDYKSVATTGTVRHFSLSLGASF